MSDPKSWARVEHELRSQADTIAFLQARLAIAATDLLKAQERLKRERHRSKLKVTRLQDRIKGLEAQVRDMTGDDHE